MYVDLPGNAVPRKVTKEILMWLLNQKLTNLASYSKETKKVPAVLDLCHSLLLNWKAHKKASWTNTRLYLFKRKLHVVKYVAIRENHIGQVFTTQDPNAFTYMRTKCLYMSDPATSTCGLDCSAQAFHCECEHSHSHKYVKFHSGFTVCQILQCLCTFVDSLTHL